MTHRVSVSPRPKLSALTSSLVTQYRQEHHTPTDARKSVREWSNDAVLERRSLSALLNPVFPLALVH